MSYYIRIQDLAANALIELLQNGKDRKISLNALYDYGVAVVEELRNGRERAYLMFSRDSAEGFMAECGDILEIRDFGSKRASVVLKDGFEVGELIERFCGSIPTPVLRAMGADGPVDVLLKAA